MTRLELVRSGGFAGLSLRAQVDTSAADEPEARWYDDALAGVDVSALAGAESPGSGSPGADRFVYRLAVERDGHRHELTFGEQAVPEPLRPVVDRLVARARGGPSPRVGGAGT
jgi:hypothetical protein